MQMRGQLLAEGQRRSWSIVSLGTAVRHAIAKLILLAASVAPGHGLVQGQDENLPNHLPEVFFDCSEVLAPDFVHVREVLHDFTLPKHSFLFAHRDVSEDFLLRC